LDAFPDTELTKEIGSLMHSNNPIKNIKELRLKRSSPFTVGIPEVALTAT
jgi:hypothetical protein